VKFLAVVFKTFKSPYFIYCISVQIDHGQFATSGTFYAFPGNDTTFVLILYLLPPKISRAGLAIYRILDVGISFVRSVAQNAQPI
jgi:hypothetical protein